MKRIRAQTSLGQTYVGGLLVANYDVGRLLASKSQDHETPLMMSNNQAEPRERSSTVSRGKRRMLLMLIGVACFGAVASLARFFVIEFFKTSVSDSFPWGTLAVNAIGCLAFGFLFTIFEERSHWDPQVRVVLLAGFAGAFTTYSTFAFESVAFLEQGKIGVALLNVAAQTIAGFSLIYLGLLFGRWVG